MADEYERISELPLASAWDGEFPQDKAGGVTERVPVSLVESKLLNLGFVKLNQVTPTEIGAEPSLGNTGVGTFFLRAINSVRSWVALGALALLDTITNNQVAANAAIAWSKISKSGAVASDVGALPASGGQNKKFALWSGTGAMTYGELSAYSTFLFTPLDFEAAGFVDGGTFKQAGVTRLDATGKFFGAGMNLTNGTANAIPKFDGSKDLVPSALTEVGSLLSAATKDFLAKSLTSARGASDTFGAGSTLNLQDAYPTGTKSWVLQLGASNTLDFWAYNGTTWDKRAKLYPDGGLELIGAGGLKVGALTGTVDATAILNSSGEIERSTNLIDNGPGGMEFLRAPVMPAPENNTPNIRMTPGSDPTFLLDGDMWFDGTSLKIRIGGVTKTVMVS